MEIKYCPTCTVNFINLTGISYLNDAGLKDFDKAMQEEVIKKEDGNKKKTSRR